VLHPCFILYQENFICFVLVEYHTIMLHVSFLARKEELDSHYRHRRVDQCHDESLKAAYAFATEQFIPGSSNVETTASKRPLH
jgi:hypothetical protein